MADTAPEVYPVKPVQFADDPAQADRHYLDHYDPDGWIIHARCSCGIFASTWMRSPLKKLARADHHVLDHDVPVRRPSTLDVLQVAFDTINRCV